MVLPPLYERGLSIDTPSPAWYNRTLVRSKEGVMPRFELVSDFKPMGDQPQAIAQLVEGVNQNMRHQTLLGATGTGKTFTVAQVVQEVQKPTLVMAHNKTLAA